VQCRQAGLGTHDVHELVDVVSEVLMLEPLGWQFRNALVEVAGNEE
jgi:hypothetical protein